MTYRTAEDILNQEATQRRVYHEFLLYVAQFLEQKIDYARLKRKQRESERVWHVRRTPDVERVINGLAVLK